MTRAEIREFITDGFDGTYDFLESKADSIFDYFSGKTCSSCRYWVKSDKNPTLMKCKGLDVLVGGEFYCGNWEKKKDER